MRRFLFLVFIMFILTGGALLFGSDYDAASPGNGINVSNGSDTERGQPYFLLHRAMELAEARVHQGELHYWAALDYTEKPLTAEALEELADVFMERLAPRFKPSYAFTRVEDNPQSKAVSGLGMTNRPDFILVEREGELYHGSRMRFLLQGMEDEGDRIVHLYITIYEEGEGRRLGELARRLPTQLEINARNSSLTFSLTGRIPMVMEIGGMERLAKDIAGKLGARQVECVRDEFMVSITGNTPLLKHVDGGGTLPVNLNLALRNDVCDDYTTIWAGTPIISGMY